MLVSILFGDFVVSSCRQCQRGNGRRQVEETKQKAKLKSQNKKYMYAIDSVENSNDDSIIQLLLNVFVTQNSP